MTRRATFKHIWVELYSRNIYWTICPREAYEKLIKNEFGEQAPKKSKSVTATYERYEKKEQNIGVIWLNLEWTMDILAHECFHATHDILNEKGFWLTDSSEESYAYLIQFIMMKILKNVRNTTRKSN